MTEPTPPNLEPDAAEQAMDQAADDLQSQMQAASTRLREQAATLFNLESPGQEPTAASDTAPPV